MIQATIKVSVPGWIRTTVIAREETGMRGVFRVIGTGNPFVAIRSLERRNPAGHGPGQRVCPRTGGANSKPLPGFSSEG
ncbi:hypothetical protein EI28_07320 [Methanoculleus sp. MH98A]|nr:hypothetical protein EI28_07320 [Methanoculleus sp. MH98A]